MSRLKDKSSSGRSLGLQGHLQYLELKLWEHPNLKVSILILKINFFKKIDIPSIVHRSKMPTSGIEIFVITILRYLFMMC